MVTDYSYGNKITDLDEVMLLHRPLKHFSSLVTLSGLRGTTGKATISAGHTSLLQHAYTSRAVTAEHGIPVKSALSFACSQSSGSG